MNTYMCVRASYISIGTPPHRDTHPYGTSTEEMRRTDSNGAIGSSEKACARKKNENSESDRERDSDHAHETDRDGYDTGEGGEGGKHSISKNVLTHACKRTHARARESLIVYFRSRSLMPKKPILRVYMFCVVYSWLQYY